MSDLKDQVSRGIAAQQLLDNQLLQDALKAIEDEVVQQWEECPARDKEGKEALWQLRKTAKKFRNILTGYIETGKLASDHMKRWEKDSKLRSLLRL